MDPETLAKIERNKQLAIAKRLAKQIETNRLEALNKRKAKNHCQNESPSKRANIVEKDTPPVRNIQKIETIRPITPKPVNPISRNSTLRI